MKAKRNPRSPQDRRRAKRCDRQALPALRGLTGGMSQRYDSNITGGHRVSTAASVACEFVRLSYAGAEPDPLTNLRLQKLLYYAQAWSLAVRGASLFPEKIQARRSGPVVRPVQSALARVVGDGVVGPKDLASAPPLDEEESAFVRAVWEAYRPFSASSLSEATREEAPWRQAWGERAAADAGAETIPAEAIADYFSRRPVPGPIAAHKRWRQEQERLARERLEAMPPLDFDAFAAMAARPSGRRKKLARTDRP
jgi:uncharacterized phage-associated protein